jgi:syntaxin 16
MATRNRTEEFINLRSLRGHGANRRDADDRELLGQPNVGSSTAVQVEPPAWVSVMNGIRQLEKQITTEHQQVEELHRQHLKVQFGGERDLDAEERNIEAGTANIARRFKLAENEIKSLDDVFRRDLGPDGGTNAELSILRNVKMCLVAELGTLSKQVRDSQRRYLRALEKQKAVRGWAGGAKQREVQDRLTKDAQIDEYLQRGCTQEQVEDILINTRLAEERDQEFQNILTSIKSLHEMFADLHSLVIEQGTMLDRIDHNMTVTHERVVQGRKQLEKAAKHQEAGTFKLMVLLLIVMIIGFAIALMVKIAA